MAAGRAKRVTAQRLTMRLQYYPDCEPGITRVRRGRGFSYLGPSCARISCETERQRLKALAVPPAYSDVWMSPHHNGHLQATGRDMRGRKQYVCHPQWHAARDVAKFDTLPSFGRTLPRLRRWIETQLRGDIGTEENASFGATTLQSRHVSFDGDTVRFSFLAKGGKSVSKSLAGKRLAHVLQASRDLPGTTLISWTDDSGAPQTVRSDQINDVLEKICGSGSTAKTLRTWNGTRAAFLTACAEGPLTISDMAQAASECLHNTPTIAQQLYPSAGHQTGGCGT